MDSVAGPVMSGEGDPSSWPHQKHQQSQQEWLDPELPSGTEDIFLDAAFDNFICSLASTSISELEQGGAVPAATPVVLAAQVAEVAEVKEVTKVAEVTEEAEVAEEASSDKEQEHPPSPANSAGADGDANRRDSIDGVTSASASGESEAEEEGGAPRAAARPRLSATQVEALTQAFEESRYLDSKRRGQLAKEIGLEPRQVAIWFQNRRARLKLRAENSVPAPSDWVLLPGEGAEKTGDSVTRDVKGGRRGGGGMTVLVPDRQWSSAPSFPTPRLVVTKMRKVDSQKPQSTLKDIENLLVKDSPLNTCRRKLLSKEMRQVVPATPTSHEEMFTFLDKLQ